MTTYSAEQIRTFIEAVDRHLSSPVRLVIVGGGAALLQHGATSTTRDIDTFESDPRPIGAALDHAKAEIGFAVPIESADIGDLPHDYEDRAITPMPELRNLQIRVPERHDLVLSKLLRGSPADLKVCAEIHAHNALSPVTLISRYLDEMDHAIGHQPTLDQSVLAGVEYIWNSRTADEMQSLVGQHRSRAQGRSRGRR